MSAYERPEWVDDRIYPFRSFFADVGYGRMHYVDAGPGRRNDPHSAGNDAGSVGGNDSHGAGDAPEPTFLLLHGNPTWSFMYRDVIRRLSDRRCVAPDWLGFGLSDKPPDWTYRPEDHVECLHRLSESLGLSSVTLVVHDWGGPIGLKWAMDRPELIEGVVILNSWLWAPDNLRIRLFGGIAGSALAIRTIDRFNVLPLLMSHAFGEAERLSTAARLHYRRALEEHAHASACLTHAFRSSRDWLDALWKRRDDLAGVRKLFVWGRRDPVLGISALERWLETFPESETRILPDVGHFVAEEAPDRVASAIVERLLEADGDGIDRGA